MKKAIMIAMLLVFCACVSSASANCGKCEAKDPVTATADVAGEAVVAVGQTAVAPVEAVLGGKKEAAK